MPTRRRPCTPCATVDGDPLGGDQQRRQPVGQLLGVAGAGRSDLAVGAAPARPSAGDHPAQTLDDLIQRRRPRRGR